MPFFFPGTPVFCAIDSEVGICCVRICVQECSPWPLFE